MKVLVVACCLVAISMVQCRPQDTSEGGTYADVDIQKMHLEEKMSPEETPDITLPADSNSGEDFVVLSDSSSSGEEGSYEEHIPITFNQRDFEEDGTYSFIIEQGDGIRRSESGTPTGPEGQIEVVGEYSFTHPDGTVHELRYTADENGFQPSSEILPTPHPLQPWHLEQIAFAEAEKRRLASGESGTLSSNEENTSSAVDAEVSASGDYSVPAFELSSSGASAEDAAPVVAISYSTPDAEAPATNAEESVSSLTAEDNAEYGSRV